MNNKGFASGRSTITREQFDRLEKANAVALDHQRSRPLWFDGRFLKAEDLTREQEYFLSRQASLALVTGVGVIEGLTVSIAEKSSTSIDIQPGHGVTSGGERVVVDRPLTVDLANTPVIQDLQVMFKKGREGGLPLRKTTGTYIVMLRPIEYAANPIASYPSRIDADRKGQEGEVIEATLVTLAPFPVRGGSEVSLLRRAHAAHEVFGARDGITIPPQALPLALVDLDGGNVNWLDTWTVRREAAAGRSDVLGFGMAPRPLREAFFLQYQDMLGDVVDHRHRNNLPARFSASTHFLLLPPAGLIPTAAVDLMTGVQYFFPPDMPVTLSFVPEDEIPLLVEESLVLPPIDLTAPAAELAATPVTIAIPIPRSKVEILRKGYVPTTSLTHPAVPVARVSLETQLSLYRRKTEIAGPAVAATSLTSIPVEWRQIAAKSQNLYYLRRASLSVEDAPPLREVAADDRDLEKRLSTRLDSLKAVTRFKNLVAKGTVAAAHAIVRTLSSRTFMQSDLLTLAFIETLEKQSDVYEALVLDLAEGFRVQSVTAGLRIIDDRVFKGVGTLDLLEARIGLIAKIDIRKLATTFASLPTREAATAAGILQEKLKAGASALDIEAAMQPFTKRLGG